MPYWPVSYLVFAPQVQSENGGNMWEPVSDRNDDVLQCAEKAALKSASPMNSFDKLGLDQVIAG